MIQASEISRLENIRDKAISEAGRSQPWDDYFELRSKEMQALLSAYELNDQGMCLEIGCGNGFNSCLLSHKAKHIVATDLFREDIKTHSQGMLATRKLFELMGANNCAALSCSGEELPFKDAAFDMVFSFNTLEHIPQKDKAVKEMSRVLKRGGIAIVVVPNFFERIFYPFVFYKYLLIRSVQFCFSKISKKRVNNKPDDKPLERERRVNSIGDFRKAYPNFPMPEPHGAYKTFWHEFMGYLPWNWINIFKRNGFGVDHVFSTIVIPWQVLSFLNSSLPIKVYSRTAILNSRLGARIPMKYLGNNICIIAKKP